MPNWCECMLTIKGKTEELEKIKEFAKDGKRVLSFNKFIPYPDRFRIETGGYAWCVQNWGTKWDLSDDTIIVQTDKILSYQFDTAWSPPIPVVMEMSRQFPLLSFTLTYDEPGMCFKGKYKVKAGKVLLDSYIERE